MKDNSRIAIALLATLATGVAFGLLFAPKKGRKMRAGIAKSIRKIGASVKDTAAAEIDRLSGPER